MAPAGGGSDDWQRDLLDAAPVPIAVYGADGSLRYVNDAAVGFVDAEGQDSLLGEPAIEFVHPEDRPAIAGRIERVLEERETVPPTEARFLTRTGDEKHAIVSGGPVTHEGEPAGQAILNDISERKRRERQLRRERDRFEVLFENLPCAVVHGVARDGEPIVLRVNRRFEEVFGHSNEDVRGANLDDLIVPDGLREAAEALGRQVMSTGRVEAEVRRETPEGVRDFLHRVVLRDTDSDTPEGYAIYVDVTEKREAQRRLRRQNELLEEFASMVAHDLRNPLTVAKLYADQFLAGSESPEIEEVSAALDRMDRIIDELLALATDGEVIGELEPVDIGTIARNAWETVQTPGAELEIRESRTVEASRNGLLELFDNLFQNAIDHGGEDVTIRVGCHETGFYVDDDGPGISPGRREEVLESGVTTRSDGTGMGLAIVNRIAEAHDWIVGVNESADGGTRIRIEGVGVDP